jgi:hypothetical protein
VSNRTPATTRRATRSTVRAMEAGEELSEGGAPFVPPPRLLGPMSYLIKGRSIAATVAPICDYALTSASTVGERAVNGGLDEQPTRIRHVSRRRR